MSLQISIKLNKRVVKRLLAAHRHIRALYYDAVGPGQ